jgi:hypothetical protein
MEDFLLLIVSGIAEILAEVVFQVVMEVAVASIARLFRNISTESTVWNPLATAVGYFLLGLLSGVLSVVVAPHPIVRPSKIHGISLLISPLITGLIMSQIGVWIRRRELRSVRIESFAYGFTFAFGIAIFRFLWLR